MAQSLHGLETICGRGKCSRKVKILDISGRIEQRKPVVSSSNSLLQNDTIAAALVLAISFGALFLVAAILHPEIVGVENDASSSTSSP